MYDHLVAAETGSFFQKLIFVLRKESFGNKRDPLGRRRISAAEQKVDPRPFQMAKKSSGSRGINSAVAEMAAGRVEHLSKECHPKE